MNCFMLHVNNVGKARGQRHNCAIIRVNPIKVVMLDTARFKHNFKFKIDIAFNNDVPDFI